MEEPDSRYCGWYDGGWYDGGWPTPSQRDQPFDFSAYLTAEEAAWFDAADRQARRIRRWERARLAAAVTFVVCLAVAAGAAAAMAVIR